MKDDASEELLLHQRIARNIAYYRKLAGMTQSELAEHINYSDKSVSKWERAAGAPDIYVLSLLADLYGVTVNDMISEDAPPPRQSLRLRRNRRIVSCLECVVLVWLVATVFFAVLEMFFPDVDRKWGTFIFAVPASAAVCVVFSYIWWGHFVRMLSVSALAWSLAAGVYLLLPENGFAYLIFAVCAVVQILVLLWYFHGKLAEKSRSQRLL